MPHLLTSTEGPLGFITLNRPDRRNALSLDLMLELIGALDQLAANPAVSRNCSVSCWFNRGSNPHSAHNRSIGWNREKSHHGSRQPDRRASAA